MSTFGNNNSRETRSNDAAFRSPSGGEATPDFKSVSLSDTRSNLSLRASNEQSVLKQPAKLNESEWKLSRAKDMPRFTLHRPITVEVDASVVLSRIDESLRVRSVQATFDGNRCQIMCKTSNFVEYSIDIYAGSDPDKEKTILEIIRMDGCSYLFSKEREIIVHAARGLGAEPKPAVERPLFKIPAEVAQQYPPPSEQDLTIFVERGVEDLHNCPPDGQLFMLQNFEAMTSSDTSCELTANIMSDFILGENVSQIRDLLVRIVMSPNETKCHSLDEKITNACLSTLLNTMVSMKARKKFSNFLETDDGRDFAENLYQPLVDKVRNLKCVHNAYLALKCLTLLIESSSITSDKIPRDVIVCAKNYGSKRYYEMENQAVSCLEKLECN